MTDKSELKKLYTRLIDSRDGYEQAIERADSEAHKSLFRELHDRRTRNASQVRSYLAQHGEEMDDDGSLLAAAHRSFLNLKDTVTGAGDEAVIEEVIRGEESLLSAYDEAIGDATGSDPEYAFVVEQYNELKARVEELRRREKRAA